jgi:hypothetical protein
MDEESQRVLTETLEIHTLELGWLLLREEDLASATTLECWLYWLLHAQEYEGDALLRLFPQEPIQLATRQIIRIAEQVEDKAMYDAREKAIRDQQWTLLAAREEGRIEGKVEGKVEGKIELIQTLESIVGSPPTSSVELSKLSMEELQKITEKLQGQIRNRTT